MVMFDHNGDGVKTGSGWVKPDDGWLALDLNGNGKIDSGRELFGDNTLLQNGQLAADGFVALAQYDGNSDGAITSADAVFASLRIWRDLNQSGVSHAGELSTLTDNGIVSINVNGTSTNIDVGNGNIQIAVSTFTRSNGAVSTIADINMLQDTFYRDFTSNIPLTEQALGLPHLEGSGQVRDLQEAISLSPAFGNLVTTYMQQTTRDGQIALLDNFMTQWA